MRKEIYLILIILIILLLSLFVSQKEGHPELSFSSPSPSASPLSQLSNQTVSAIPKSNVLANSQINADKIEKYLTVETALLGVSDNVSLYFKDLNSNTEVSIDPTRSWIPASTIKAYVVLEAFRQRDLGLINFDQQIVIKAQNVVPTELETDEFPRLREGTTATIQQLVEAMVIQSDNTAYNSLLDILDRRNINSTLHSIGITETVVGEKLNLDDNQFQADLAVPGRQPNTTTAKDLATFFDLLYNHKVADADEILAIFKRQKINTMIPALLPSDTPIAHKTGDWAPIYHDGGVVYKPSSPFILSVFTNSGNQVVISKLAQIAYFKDPSYLGSSNQLSKTNSSASFLPEPRPIIALAPSAQNNFVLGAQIPDKFPTIDASDLGITSGDLNITPEQIDQIKPARIYPGSFMYSVKRFVENFQLILPGDNETKAKRYISLSKSRLAEIKSLLAQGDTKNLNSLLSDSNNDLFKAATIANNDSNKDVILADIKQINDLHFAVLNQAAGGLSSTQKDTFIDSVYAFYQNNHRQVVPIINSSVIANPTLQKPAIGQITSIHGNKVTMQFDDQTTKQLTITDSTKVRTYQDQFYQTPSSLKVGDKIAVMGVSGSQNTIIPQFILRNVPSELPNVHKGTIIGINPNQNTFEILNQQGEEELIKVDSLTSLRSRDTQVSLEGIIAGSQIAVFGTAQFTPRTNVPHEIYNSAHLNSSTPSALLPTPMSKTVSPVFQGLHIATPESQVESTSLPTDAPFSKMLESSHNSHSSAKASPTPQTSVNDTVIELHATSITVISNDPGKNEVITPPSPKAPTKDEPKKQHKPK